jgi:antitoxin CptB
MTPHDDARIRKLRFRAWRRGIRETDLILGPFADNHVQHFTPEQLDRFEALLEVPDTDLYAWIVGREPTPEAFDDEIMSMIKEFRYEVRAVRGDDIGG